VINPRTEDDTPAIEEWATPQADLSGSTHKISKNKRLSSGLQDFLLDSVSSRVDNKSSNLSTVWSISWRLAELDGL
jgi:hypothetical protein